VGTETTTGGRSELFTYKTTAELEPTFESGLAAPRRARLNMHSSPA